MRTLFLLLFFFFFSVSAASAVTALCLHYQKPSLTANSCALFKDALEAFFGRNSVSFHFDVYSDQNLEEEVDILYLSGFATPDGYWRDRRGRSRISWKELMQKIRAPIVFIDSCYSGNAFDYSQGKFLVTSSGRNSVSVNLLDFGRLKNVSTFSAMLYCMAAFEAEKKLPILCEKYSSCKEDDPQICQMEMILKGTLPYRGVDSFLKSLKNVGSHPNVQLGTVHVNGKPMRKWFR